MNMLKNKYIDNIFSNYGFVKKEDNVYILPDQNNNSFLFQKTDDLDKIKNFVKDKDPFMFIFEMSSNKDKELNEEFLSYFNEWFYKIEKKGTKNYDRTNIYFYGCKDEEVLDKDFIDIHIDDFILKNDKDLNKEYFFDETFYMFLEIDIVVKDKTKLYSMSRFKASLISNNIVPNISSKNKTILRTENGIRRLTPYEYCKLLGYDPSIIDQQISEMVELKKKEKNKDISLDEIFDLLKDENTFNLNVLNSFLKRIGTIKKIIKVLTPYSKNKVDVVVDDFFDDNHDINQLYDNLKQWYKSYDNLKELSKNLGIEVNNNLINNKEYSSLIFCLVTRFYRIKNLLKDKDKDEELKYEVCDKDGNLYRYNKEYNIVFSNKGDFSLFINNDKRLETNIIELSKEIIKLEKKIESKDIKQINQTEDNLDDIDKELGKELDKELETKSNKNTKKVEILDDFDDLDKELEELEELDSFDSMDLVETKPKVEPNNKILEKPKKKKVVKKKVKKIVKKSKTT